MGIGGFLIGARIALTLVARARVLRGRSKYLNFMISRGILGATRTVLMNLLSNARKFTTRGYIRTHISLGAENALRFTVTDTGTKI